MCYFHIKHERYFPILHRDLLLLCSVIPRAGLRPERRAGCGGCWAHGRGCGAGDSGTPARFEPRQRRNSRELRWVTGSPVIPIIPLIPIIPHLWQLRRLPRQGALRSHCVEWWNFRNFPVSASLWGKDTVRKCTKKPHTQRDRRAPPNMPKQSLRNAGRRGQRWGQPRRARGVLGAGRRLPAFSPPGTARAPRPARRQPQGASARWAAPAAISPCAAAAAASGRCGAAAERIKAAGGAARPRVFPCLWLARPLRALPARGNAGAERRPPPASPARGPAAAAGARLHVGGRYPRLQRGRRRLAEPGGVLGRGRRQPAARTRRAGGRAAGAAAAQGPGTVLRSAERPGPGHGGWRAGKVRAGSAGSRAAARAHTARCGRESGPGHGDWSRCLAALGAPLPGREGAGRARTGAGRALLSLSPRPVPKAIPRDG